MNRLIAASLGAALLVAAPALADPTPPMPQVVRGTVTAITPTALTLKSREGQVLTIGLAKDWNVQVTVPITAAGIQTGSFIGTSEMPQKDGTGRSLEVHVFPPGVKMGEGHYGWDLKKGSMMTNGTVGKVVASANGRDLEVAYAGGVRHILVPPGVPVVTTFPGARSDVKAGIGVVVFAGKLPNGDLATNRILIGEHGEAPPM